jgi:hypothetical protein
MRPSRTFLVIYYMESRAVNALGTAGVVSLGGSTGDASPTRAANPGIMEVVIVGALKWLLFRICWPR